MQVERKTNIDYLITGVAGQDVTVMRYDIEKDIMVGYYDNLSATGSELNIRIVEDGVYRFNNFNTKWGFTFVTNEIDEYIKAGLLKYRNTNPCEDCSSYDFCNLLIVMQTYYSIMFAVKNDAEYEAYLSNSNIPYWVAQAAKLIEQAHLYILN